MGWVVLLILVSTQVQSWTLDSGFWISTGLSLDNLPTKFVGYLKHGAEEVVGQDVEEEEEEEEAHSEFEFHDVDVNDLDD